eukprot:6988406-Prymnesium_polylepis.1
MSGSNAVASLGLRARHARPVDVAIVVGAPLPRLAAVRRVLRVLRSREAARAQRGGRDRKTRPLRAGGRRALPDEGALDRRRRAICKEDRLLLAHKVERMLLEALLRQRSFGRRAEPVRVAAAVVVAHVPRHGRLAADAPGRAGRHLRQVGAAHPVVRVRGVGVDALLRRAAAPRSAASEATGVRHRSGARPAPRVVTVDVGRASRGRVQVEAARRAV